MTKLQSVGTVEPSLAQAGGLDPSDPAYAGQAQYTPSYLKHVYDPLVVHFTNRFLWRCPTSFILGLYRAHLSDRHLEVGPGTGWFLAHSTFPTGAPSLTLTDINADVLDAASARLARYSPRRHQANLLEPLDPELGTFDSIAITHVLHCLPGTMADKGRALGHLVDRLAPGGTLYGTTVLGTGVRHSPPSRALVRSLNKKGVFGNQADDPAGLEHALAALGKPHTLTVRGTAGVFTVQG